ncbi:integrase core domain-containing protein [Thermodesulfobacteriota bacterium]
MFAVDSFGLSQRRACRLLPLCRNTLRYKPQEKDDEALRTRMRELAKQRRRSGCKMLHAILRREGLVINHKRTERIYREEGLALQIRRRKKRASVMRIERDKPTRPNEQWAMDFVSDGLANGRRIREECLNVHWFMSMNHARRAIEEWRVDYNTERPHSSLNDMTPEEFMRKETEKMKKNEILNYT